MTNHVHLIARADGESPLSEFIRDLKKYTSKAIIAEILKGPESRKEWMLEYFKKSAKSVNKLSNQLYFKLWQDGYHPEMIESNKFFNQKLRYIHNNPVKELIVEKPEEYIFSSARNYAGFESYIDIVLESKARIANPR